MMLKSRSPARTWPRILAIASLSVAAGVGLTLLLQDGSRFFPKLRHTQLISAQAMVRRETGLLEKKVSDGSASPQDLAILAGIYCGQAKMTGDITFYDRAESLAHKSLELLASPNTPAQVVLAQVAQARHEFRKSIELAERILAESSSPVGSLSLLITGNLALGNIEEAGKRADQLIDARPGLGTYSLRALVMAAQGKTLEAEDDFQSALRVQDFGEDMEASWVHSIYARFLMKHGRYTDAERHLKRALELNPGYHFALDLEGLLAADRGNWQEADRWFGEAFSASKQVLYLEHLGKVKLRLGEAAAARGYFDQAEKAIRGELAAGAYGHRLELARLLLDRAEALGSDDSSDSGHPLAGLSPRGQAAGASALLNPSVSEALVLTRSEAGIRHNPETLLVLARTLRVSGKVAEANDAIRSALRFGADDPEYFHEAALIEKAAHNPRRAGFLEHRAVAANPRFTGDDRDLIF